jgi:energy-coupling factor transport system ATP-binding protein
VRDVGIRHEGAETPTPAAASFSVARGEVVLLLGPSGAGKSTLALALNGLIPHAVPASLTGTVQVAGLDTRRPRRRPLDARRNGLPGPRCPARDRHAPRRGRVRPGEPQDAGGRGPLAREDALRRVGLWERRHENPDRLSGGGRQRLAIACALAMGSPLLVLDEPTANLDPQGIEEVYAALEELVAAGDRAIVLIEHNLDAAARITDRVVVLDRRPAHADGTVDDVLRRRAELHAMGVWLPVATLAALRLRAAGWTSIPSRSIPTNCARHSTRRMPRPRRRQLRREPARCPSRARGLRISA